MRRYKGGRNMRIFVCAKIIKQSMHRSSVVGAGMNAEKRNERGGLK